VKPVFMAGFGRPRLPLWGAWATAPIYRGSSATSPKRPGPPYGVRGLTTLT
jgi:hypothetical protein